MLSVLPNFFGIYKSQLLCISNFVFNVNLQKWHLFECKLKSIIEAFGIAEQG